ncbi:MAG: hypothetical protein HUK20_15260 [Fibrobacter sp.]|nr:hypothetical protein [Fibrobacter sp.]
MWTKLIRRSLLLEHEIRFSEVLKLYEDGLVALQVFNAAKVVAYRSCPTYHYRILNNSLCHINETRLVKDCGCILEELQKYMRASRCDNILGDAFYARTLFLTKKMALRSFFARGAQGSFLKRFRAFKEILLTEPYRTAVKRAASLKLVGNEKNYGRLMGHGLFFMTALMYECRARLLRR